MKLVILPNIKTSYLLIFNIYQYSIQETPIIIFTCNFATFMRQLIFCMLLICFVSCQNRNVSSVTSEDSTKGSESQKLVFNQKWNDYALFCAGLPQKPNSVIGKTDSAYNILASDFSNQWKQMDENRLKKMRTWEKEELAKHIKTNNNLFYPFSGADFLHAHQFFPNAKKCLYIANEPVGDVKDIEKMNNAERLDYFKQITVALGDIFKRSYFITSRMRTQIPTVKGVIPIYLVFMARSNMKVLNVEIICLKTDASVENKKVSGENEVEGVRFTYCPNNNENDIRTLEYFNCDASNVGMQKSPQVIAYIKKFGRSNVFFKAASYLMHNPGFSEFRDACLEITDAVLEDDTGLPYVLLKDKFTPHLYGKYVKPIADFGKGGYQMDLAEAFKDSTIVKPLPFSLGYHWFDRNQNYMLFVRK